MQGGTDLGDLGVTSRAFDAGDRIPDRYTCTGDDVSPPLAFAGVPDDAAALALIVDDPDAPRAEPWVHWLVWNAPGDADGFPEAVPPDPTVDALGGAAQGENDFGNTGYGGPCPPEGHGTHRYRFTLFALSEEVDLAPGATRDELEAAMEGRVLDTGRLVGTYSRG